MFTPSFTIAVYDGSVQQQGGVVVGKSYPLQDVCKVHVFGMLAQIWGQYFAFSHRFQIYFSSDPQVLGHIKNFRHTCNHDILCQNLDFIEFC